MHRPFVSTYDSLLEDIGLRLDAVFDIRPVAEVAVVEDTAFGGGGFYVGPTVDGSRPGAFHAGLAGGWGSRFQMPSIAYHQAVPGHHFQEAIHMEQDQPLLRNDLFFNAYGEGWALCADRLGSERGAHDQDSHGYSGRLRVNCCANSGS